MFKKSVLLIFFVFANFSSAQKIILDKKIFKNNESQNLDEVMLSYFSENKNLYVAIVWPRAFPFLEKIKKMLSSSQHLLYQKNFQLTKYAPSYFFQYIHPEIFKNVITNELPLQYKIFLNNYIPKNLCDPYDFSAIIFETNHSPAAITSLKYTIRAQLNMSFFSIHIDDCPTMAHSTAQIILNDHMLEEINNLYPSNWC